MKINPVGNVMGQYAKLKVYANKEDVKNAMGTDRLELSDRARLFTEAMNAAKKNMEATEANKHRKMEQIKAQIAQGEYYVSADEISKKLFLG
jgi:anti-sigma28 factor (negative regulator of flagellin synthesis)